MCIMSIKKLHPCLVIEIQFMKQRFNNIREKTSPKYNYFKNWSYVKWDIPLDIVCHIAQMLQWQNHASANCLLLHIVNFASEESMHFFQHPPTPYTTWKISLLYWKWASQGNVNVISRVFRSAFLFFSFLLCWTGLVAYL